MLRAHLPDDLFGLRICARQSACRDSLYPHGVHEIRASGHPCVGEGNVLLTWTIS